MSAPAQTTMGRLFDGAPDMLDEFLEPAAPAAKVLEMPRKPTLRDYLEGTDLILEALEQLDAEALTDEQRDILSADLISALAGTRAKVDNVHRCLAMFEGLEAAAEAEIKRLENRAARFARQRERLTDYVLATMEASNLGELAGDTVTLKVKRNPPAVAIDDAAQIPAALKKHKPAPPPEPNKQLIAAELKAGREVPGARLVQSVRLARS